MGAVASRETRQDGKDGILTAVVSRENVELVKALFPKQSTDLTGLIRDEDAFAHMREEVGPFFADDYEDVTVLPGETRTYIGLEGARQLWLDWFAPWATYRSTIDDVIDAGDRVVVLLRDYGRRKDTDAEVELVGAAIWTIRDGKVVRIEHHADRAGALAAAGLSQDTHAPR